MLIRSKNRLYYFDRHISDAVLRLLVVLVWVFFGFTSYLLVLRTNSFIDAVFWPKLQDEIADLTGKETGKLGSSEKTIFTQAMETMNQDGAGITAFPEYAYKISPGNQAVYTVELKLVHLKIAVRAAGLALLAIFILLLLVVRVIYGKSERRWRLFRWLFRFFNKDSTERQPYGYVHSFNPFQRKIFEMCFAASKGSPEGRFDLDVEKFASHLWPGEEQVTDRRRSLIATAFSDLCEEYFYFQIPYRKSNIIKTYCPFLPESEENVKREFLRDLAGREVQVFTAGQFRFSPPLYFEFLKSRYHKLPHSVVYSLDDRKHPFAFRIYLTLWEIWCDRKQESEKDAHTMTVSITLFDLLDRACLEMSYDHDSKILEQTHADIAKLREMGFIRGWYAEENGEKVHPTWFKGVELFAYDSQRNTYHLQTSLLANKIYYFDLTPYSELEKVKISRRKCSYIDNLNTPCNRPALPGSPYCKRHARALDFESPKLFYEKVKQLAPPGKGNESASPGNPGDPPQDSNRVFDSQARPVKPESPPPETSDAEKQGGEPAGEAPEVVTPVSAPPDVVITPPPPSTSDKPDGGGAPPDAS